VFVGLAARVFAGDVTAPLVALLVVLAPLLALLRGGGRGGDAPGPDVVSTVVGLSALGMVLSANVMVVTAVASLLGVPFPQSAALLGVSACLILVCRRAPFVSSLAFIVGIAGLTVLVAAMGVALPAAPWTTWAQLASRPALAFSPGTAWVSDGRTVPRATTLVFDETHQVTALSGGVFRVEEGERSDRTVQERRLNPGDSLMLRAGDRLTIPPDVRVRFEAGKRIPGTPRSGVAWAEPPRHPSWPALVEALGLALTMTGGAVMLLGGHSRATRLSTAVGVPLLLIAFAFSASSWGVYAVWFAADLGLGASSLAPLLAAVHVSLDGKEPAHLPLLGALALGMLFVAAAAGLANRMAALTESWRADEARPAARLLLDVLWLGMLGAAVMLSQYELEPGTILRLGLGLGASAWAAPRLGGARGGVVAGAVTGVVVFSALSIAHALALPAVTLLGPYPALVAAPAAVVVAVVGRRRRPSPRALRLREPRASVAGSGRP
jgi:hypothetical protein